MKETYVIGEIGQNHNGSVIIAKEIIDRASQPIIDPLFNRELKPMNAVKLTKRDLNEELSASAMCKPYTSQHSFGSTYGKHREALELNDEEHYEIYKYTKSKGLDFVETLCGIGCTSMFKYFEPDRLKVASRDLTNLPLLNVLAETKIPIILSTGMGGPKELDNALEIISKHHNNISILHCLSQYPSDYQNINLLTIPYLQKRYPEYTIGYSDHSIGIVIPVAAVTLGADIIEKHITLDRNMRGTDQAGSLAPDGVYRMMRDIRNLEQAFGTEDMFVDDSVKEARVKLERSIASKESLRKGHVFIQSDLHMLSPGNGIKWINRNDIIGKTLNIDLPKDEVIYPNMIS